MQSSRAARYDEWVAFWNLPAGQHGLAKDFDADGIPNLLEFAYGSNPWSNSIAEAPSFALSASPGKGIFTFHRAKNATGLTIDLMHSADLVAWSALVPAPADVFVLDHGSYEEVRNTVPLDQGQGFYRLRVSLASGIVPDQTYPSSLENRQIGPTLGAAHHNQPHIINGYLVLAGNAEHEFWDITDPFNPLRVAQVQSPYHSGEAESHTVSFARYPNGHTYMVTISGLGIDLWDVTDVRDPVLLNAIVLEGINYGDFTEAVWGVCWQGKYIYAGGTSTGLHVIDASDPANPVLVTRLPTTSLGGVSAGPVFALGNLLVITTPKNSAGIATLDIGNPASPVLQGFVKPSTASYIGWFYKTYAFLQTPLRIYDVTTDPANFQLVKSMSTVSSEYMNFGDDILYLGLLRPNPGALKYDISNPLNPVLLGKVQGRTNLLGNDDQFTVPVGNLLVLSDDQANFGSIIAVASAQRDTIPPRIVYFNPVNGATNQPLTTRIGISFTDQIDLRSINSQTVLIRPVGGQPLTGTWGLMHYLLNFWPDEPLQSNTLYEILVPAGGVTDLVGNPLTQEYRSVFSTGGSASPLAAIIQPLTPVLAGQTASFQAAAQSGAQYRWQFGDGSDSGFSASPSATHTYTAPGRYPVVLTVSDGQQTARRSAFQIVHRPLTANQPARSSTILLDEPRDRAWVVNPDSATVSAISISNLTKVLEVSVGAKPTTLAQAPDGTIWVVNQDSFSISILNPTNGQTLQTIPLHYGVAPYGIVFSPNGSNAYVTLQGVGQVLKFDSLTRSLLATTTLGPDTNGIVPQLRGLAVSHDSTRLFVTRFISPTDHGEVYEMDANSLALVRTFGLANDPGPDTPDSGRGIPNYISSLTISPDGQRAWVPSKKDNTSRGLNRDGLPLTHENAVRTILSQLDLVSNLELLTNRVDLNDRDMAFAAAFSALGDLLFVATQGQNHVDVLNAYNGELVGSLASGLAPQGLALTSTGRLLVQNFMSRSVTAFDVSQLLAGQDTTATRLASINVVATELLTPEVLLGKQIFYNADSRQMNKDGYISCASCHLDGGSDSRVWDFTDRGEGFRNTIALRGRGGTSHGPVHWTGNLDEIQDFENDMRFHFRGLGFLSDTDFTQGTRSQPLGAPKAGLNVELDALAAYAASLTRVPASPYRNADGSMTADAIAGEGIFNSLNCANCHSGPKFTDSAVNLLHDVGTIKPASGSRLGAPLTGFDTPTLRGLWESAPYLHDGSANTLDFVLTNSAHGNAYALTQSDRDKVVAYLLQLDDGVLPDPATSPNPANGATNVSFAPTLSWTAGAATTSHDVYFGTSSNAVAVATHGSAEFKGNQAARTYQPGALALGTPYYWKITEVNSFGSNAGPVWRFTTTTVPPPTRLEAENAQLSGGVVVSSDHPGYSGTGFADYPSGTGTNVAVSFNAYLLAAGTRNLAIRYANGGTTTRSLQLRVNGVVIQNTVNFPATGDWAVWQIVTINSVSLLSGTNKIDLVATQTAGPNVDYLELQ